MDYSTMASKIDGHAYKSMKDFRKDFDLIINNCLEFNGIESPLYKIALKHQKQVFYENIYFKLFGLLLFIS